MGDQAVAVITPDAAKARALAIIKAHTEAVSFVRSEDIDTQGMFLPIVSVIPLAPGDLHQLGGGQMMPKKHHVDRMAEAAGVNVISVDVEHPSPYVWVGKAHGIKRMPDGTMREGEGEYSFDAEKYAELDFLKDTKSKYSTDTAKRIHLLEYAKFGHQRASTGARLALIRYFCKCPCSFGAQDLPKAMIFSRVDLNTDGLLASPDMREAAIAHAVGATRTLFGPVNGMVARAERNVTPTAEAIEAPAAEAPARDPFDDEPEPATAPGEQAPEQKALAEARARLEEWAASDLVKAHKRAGPAVAALLAKPDATLEEYTRLIGLCAELQDWQRAHAKGGRT
jgi:hypothetical protein